MSEPTSPYVLHVNGVDICVQSFGDRSDPGILLIGGASASMDWWPDEFCQRLADGARFVIRYDSRDTGQSTTYPAGAPEYTASDMVGDAVALLDHFDIERGHIVGISGGGALSQRLAVGHPERVATLTLMSTSPDGPADANAAELPGSSPEVHASFAEPDPEPDWSDRSAVIDYLVTTERIFEGARDFDEAALRDLVGRVFDRTQNMAASMSNHYLVDSGDPIRHRLGAISAPTLVIHGTEDPLFPLPHGHALASEIPGASLLTLEGVGHQVPPPRVWDVVIPALLRHTSGGWDEQADRLAARSLAAGDPVGWFDRLYRSGAAGAVDMPWDRERPHPLLSEWAQNGGIEGVGRSAIVVGAGLGADAEFVAGLGFQTIAFDVSATAIQVAQQRYPESGVDYVRADLLALPADWTQRFDLVIEIFTVQALPRSVRRDAIASVVSLVAPGGSLLVIAAIAQEAQSAEPGPPPWPLTRVELESFATDGLTRVLIEEAQHPGQPGKRRWRGEFRRSA